MSDLTVEILKDIRDGVRQTNQKLEETKRELRDEIRATNERLDTTNERLDRLERTQIDTELRVSTEITAVVGAINQLRDGLFEDRKLPSAVRDHEARIRKLEKRRVS
jgi:predicted phage gp36 major capsid-like protein